MLAIGDGSQFRSVTVRGEHERASRYLSRRPCADQQCQSPASGEKLWLRTFRPIIRANAFGAGDVFDTLQFTCWVVSLARYEIEGHNRLV